MEPDYSKREIDALTKTIENKFNDVHKKIDDVTNFQNQKLDSIEAQTKKTNGRVSNLENWRWFIMGGLAIVTALVLPVALILIQQSLAK